MLISKEKVCGIIGRGSVKKETRQNLEKRIEEEIKQAVSDGCIHFMTCLADECDLIFAHIIRGLKEENKKITLEVILPYRHFIEKKGRFYKEMLGKCDIVGSFAEEESQECYEEAKRFLVSNSDIVMVIYNEKNTGNPYGAVNLARMIGKEIRVIEPMDA